MIEMLFEVDGDEFEGDIHFFADLDCFFEREVVGGNGFVEFIVVMVEFSLGKESVSYFCFSEILFCVFDFEVFLCE
jgi:hypothetical protein